MAADLAVVDVEVETKIIGIDYLRDLIAARSV